jgi:hypothetical protein
MFTRYGMKKYARNSLWPNDSDEDDKGSDCAKEDTLNRRVIGYDGGFPVLYDRDFHMVPTYCLDLRGCRRNHLSYQQGR